MTNLGKCYEWLKLWWVRYESDQILPVFVQTPSEFDWILSDQCLISDSNELRRIPKDSDRWSPNEISKSLNRSDCKIQNSEKRAHSWKFLNLFGVCRSPTDFDRNIMEFFCQHEKIQVYLLFMIQDKVATTKRKRWKKHDHWSKSLTLPCMSSIHAMRRLRKLDQLKLPKFTYSY